jgi:hypothetical protein
MRFPGEDGGQSLAAMAQRDLVATLQLLAERAQYITGATGAAIALRHNGEMTCRASAGRSAPEVGAQLQVDSGLSGESIRTRKTLRCDEAASDPRVNRESCEALGIASVVVMPLVHGIEVIGVFELFSDKPNVFAARDITALERMGAMVFTALEHALSALQAKADAELAAPGDAGEGVGAAVPVAPRDDDFHPSLVGTETADDSARVSGEASPQGVGSGEGIRGADTSGTGGVRSFAGLAFHMKTPATVPGSTVASPAASDADDVLGSARETSATVPAEAQAGLQEEVLETSAPSLPEVASEFPETPYPGFESDTQEAVAPANFEGQAAPSTARTEVSNLRRCEGCGFPVSEGRQLCLDCERKAARDQRGTAKTAALASERAGEPAPSVPSMPIQDGTPTPRFLHQEPEQPSWLSAHMYTMGVVVVVVAAIVIFLLTR